MEKEGGLLADRPRAVAAGEIMSRGLRMILAPAGEQFRRLRRYVTPSSTIHRIYSCVPCRAAHTHLQAKAAESYAPIQMQAASDVIIDILNDPKHHQAHANRYAASVILRVTYGKSTATETDAPEIILIHKMLKRFQTLMRPGALLIERYPILKYVPGYASYLEEWRKEERQLFHDQLDRVARELVCHSVTGSELLVTSGIEIWRCGSLVCKISARKPGNTQTFGRRNGLSRRIAFRCWFRYRTSY